MPTSNPRANIRVLFISARADQGGGPRHMRDLILKLKQAASVEAYTASPISLPYGPEFQRLSRQFVEIPHRSFSITSFWKLVKLVRRANIQIVHSHGRGAGLYSRLIGVFTKAVVVHTFHGVHEPIGLKAKVGFWIDRVLGKIKMTAIFVSATEMQAAKTLGFVGAASHQVIIENGINLDIFSMRNSAQRGPEFITCGTFLRDDPAKAPDAFLKLVRELSRIRPEWVWKCAGISHSALSRWGEVPSNLEIYEQVDRPHEWLKSLDYYFSTSISEGQPLGVLEAMATGAVCILSEIPAHEKFILSDAAIPLRNQEPVGLAITLDNFIGSPERLIELRNRARSLIETEHSLTAMSAKISGLYAELVSFPKPAPSSK